MVHVRRSSHLLRRPVQRQAHLLLLLRIRQVKRTQLSRNTPLKAKKPIKKVNKRRRAAEFQRAFGGEQRVEWIHRQACVVFRYGKLPENLDDTDDFDCEGPIEAMHPEGRKDAKTVPACRKHHRMAHDKGHRTFARTFGLNLSMAADLYDALWTLFAQIAGIAA